MAYDYRSTAAKIRDCREQHELGMDEAKRIVLRDELRREIQQAEDLEDIKRILLAAFPALEHSNDY